MSNYSHIGEACNAKQAQEIAGHIDIKFLNLIKKKRPKTLNAEGRVIDWYENPIYSKKDVIQKVNEFLSELPDFLTDSPMKIQSNIKDRSTSLYY